MPNAPPERRNAPRYPLDIPVRMERRDARTRDLSSGGVYLLTHDALEIGEEVSVDLTLPHASELGPLHLRLRARVLRVETGGNGSGAAAVIEAWDVVGGDFKGPAHDA